MIESKCDQPLLRATKENDIEHRPLAEKLCLIRVLRSKRTKGFSFTLQVKSQSVGDIYFISDFGSNTV